MQPAQPGGAPPASMSRRNRGNLPKDLPREEIVLAPERKACPCCGGTMHIIGEDVAEQLDIVPAQFKVIHPPAPLRLSGVRGCGRADPSAEPPDRWRHGHRSADRPCHRRQVCGPLSALSPGLDLRPAWHRSRSLDPGSMGRTGGLVARSSVPTPARRHHRLAGDLQRRHALAGARSRSRQDRASVGLWTPRAPLARRYPTRHRLCLLRGAKPRASAAGIAALQRCFSGRRLPGLRSARRRATRRQRRARTLLGAFAAQIFTTSSRRPDRRSPPK